MAAERSLSMRQRLALGLLALCVGICALFAGAIWTGYVWLENSTMENILGRELDVFIDAATPPARINRSASGLKLYRPARAAHSAPPLEILLLPPGSYRDVRIGKSHAHVLVRDVTPGDRVWLTYDVSTVKSRERWALLALCGGVLLAALLSWRLSGWIARRTLRPLEQVVQRIAALHPQAAAALPAGTDRDELSVIVRALEQRMTEIEQLVQRERAFAGAAAHELRTPLTVIGIAAETLAAQAAVPPAPVARIRRAVESATQDLDALLALARGRDLPPAQPLRLHEWLPQLAEPYMEGARQNGTRLTWDLAEITAALPPGPLGIIFTNLLRNALRAASGGEVRIVLTADALTVSDNGGGIPADELERVFEPGTHGKNGGSGIGLYISRALAERCGWMLSLHSEPGQGTRAELRFQ